MSCRRRVSIITKAAGWPSPLSIWERRRSRRIWMAGRRWAAPSGRGRPRARNAIAHRRCLLSLQQSGLNPRAPRRCEHVMQSVPSPSHPRGNHGKAQLLPWPVPAPAQAARPGLMCAALLCAARQLSHPPPRHASSSRRWLAMDAGGQPSSPKRCLRVGGPSALLALATISVSSLVSSALLCDSVVVVPPRVLSTLPASRLLSEVASATSPPPHRRLCHGGSIDRAAGAAVGRKRRVQDPCRRKQGGQAPRATSAQGSGKPPSIQCHYQGDIG